MYLIQIQKFLIQMLIQIYYIIISYDIRLLDALSVSDNLSRIFFELSRKNLESTSYETDYSTLYLYMLLFQLGHNARFTHSHDALRMPKISIRDGGSRI